MFSTRKIKCLFYLDLIIISLVVCQILFPTKAPPILAAPSSSEIITLHNNARANQGLDALQSNGLLSQAAQAKANDMLAHDYFAHTSPSGQTPWQWITNTGYDYEYAGENLAIDFYTAQSLQEAWMNSPTHRANIMNKLGIHEKAGLVLYAVRIGLVDVDRGR